MTPEASRKQSRKPPGGVGEPYELVRTPDDKTFFVRPWKGERLSMAEGRLTPLVIDLRKVLTRVRGSPLSPGTSFVWPDLSPLGERLKINHCEFPDRLLYDVEQGTWADLKGDVIRVGITSLLSWSFGVFSAITFRNLGTGLVRGQVMGTMEGSRHFDVFRSPVSGTLSAVNERLIGEPWLLNKDSYGEGWFADIRVEDNDELRALGSLPQVEHRITELLKERHVHCFAAFPDFQIFDTGVECQAVLAKLNDLLESSTPGTVVHVVSDDSSAEIEMQRWSDQTGNSILDVQKEGKVFHYIVRKEPTEAEQI